MKLLQFMLKATPPETVKTDAGHIFSNCSSFFERYKRSTFVTGENTVNNRRRFA
jgi:hypothetical protein